MSFDTSSLCIVIVIIYILCEIGLVKANFLCIFSWPKSALFHHQKTEVYISSFFFFVDDRHLVMDTCVGPARKVDIFVMYVFILSFCFFVHFSFNIKSFLNFRSHTYKIKVIYSCLIIAVFLLGPIALI